MTRASRLLLALAAVFLVWTCDKATPVAPADSTLTISANPTRIDVFGTATITVIGRKTDGAPVNEGTEVNLSTTAGELAETLLRTDDRGIAETELQGVGEIATATVTASSGAAGEATVDIQIGAPASSITLQATPRRVKKDGGEIELVATVRDDEANAILNALVTFETEAGKLKSRGGAVETDEKGEARDKLTVTEADIERLALPSILVTASVPGEGGELLSTDEEIPVAGVPFEIILTSNPGTVDQEGGEVDLVALVIDDRGKGVSGEGVIFSADVGGLASGGRQVTTNNRGEAADRLTLTAQDLGTFALGETFGVSARTPSLLEEATDTIRVTGEPQDGTGAPATVSLTVSKQSVPETGDTVFLSALVLDSGALIVPGTGVIFSADAGTLGSGGSLVLTGADGRANDTLTLTATDLSLLAGDTVTVTAQAPAGSGPEDNAAIVVQRSGGQNPTQLFLTASESRVEETKDAKVTLTALVLDSEGRTVSGTGVIFSSPVGSLDSGGGLETTAESTGEAKDDLTLTSDELLNFTANQFDVTAQAPSGTNVTGTATIEILRAAVASFTCSTNTSNTTVVFNSNSTTGTEPLTFSWKFGDDADVDCDTDPDKPECSERNPSMIYNDTEAQTVTLTVTNDLSPGPLETATRTVTPRSGTPCTAPTP